MYAHVIIARLFIVHITTIFASSCPNPSPHVTNPIQIPDYYWRDYYGLIPKDAVEGGQDQAANTTYIGQVFVGRFGLQPAVISSGCKSARATISGKVLTTSRNVKILCTNNKEKMEWISTKNLKADLLTGRLLVDGGFEGARTFNIGRVSYDGEIIIGKVYSNVDEIDNHLWIPHEHEVFNFLSYEILTYNPNKK